MFKLTTIGLVCVLIGYQLTKNDRAHTSNKLEDHDFPVIIDTSKLENLRRETTWLSTANFELMYIGKWQDTIYPNYTLKHFRRIPPLSPKGKHELINSIEYQKREASLIMSSYYVDWMDTVLYRYWHFANLSIKVDTMQRIKNDDYLENGDIRYFEAYPVVIENNDEDTIIVGYGCYLPLITEAKDSLGNWKPIEEKWIYFCGNGVGNIILPPNEIGLTATNIYHGNYATTLRLNLDSIYSNEFNGQINYRQFKSRYNEDGFYSKEYELEMKKEN